jgi:ATP-dependent DNA helicase RecQ
MYDFCTGVTCRHQSIVRHFGQDLRRVPCNACDVCLSELDLVDEPMIVGQKILSCVLRLRERFGADYTTQVLNGSQDQRILQHRHDQLSTWGILDGESRRTIRDWIEQLVGQGFLVKEGEYNVLRVTPEGRLLLKGEVTPRLLRPASPKKRKRAPEDSWDGVDRGLFEQLRGLRRKLANELAVPAYIVFGDASLRDMARLRPSDVARFQQVKGVGERKLAEYGRLFVDEIVRYCGEHDVQLDVEP